ncbi:MAG: AAA family ATPase [Treponema sp.]|nr:AAA family ATPase [Treponema sp.]
MIIIDEIQELPSALTSLKYFCENGREYHVVASGSLLGLSLHSVTDFPERASSAIAKRSQDFPIGSPSPLNLSAK